MELDLTALARVVGPMVVDPGVEQPPVSWWAFDFATGARLWPIATAKFGAFGRRLNADTTTTLDVRVAHDGIPLPGWDEGTTPGRRVLACLDPDDRILWAGLSRRRTSGLGPVVQVSCDTLEKYLGRRYINSVVKWTDDDPSKIAADVIAACLTGTGTPPFATDATPTGNRIVNGYWDTDDNKTCRSALDELASLDGGIEWTIEPEWADGDHTHLRYRIVIRPRIGSADAHTLWTHQAGVGGSITDVDYVEDYGDETGANDTLAFSSGQGASQPRSTRYVADELHAAGWARFEKRFTPATSITSTRTLDQYAEADHKLTRFGRKQVSITARLEVAPVLNLDWWMGDDIDVAITSERWPAKADADGALQPGFSARMRTVGWDMDLDAHTITPIAQGDWS